MSANQITVPSNARFRMPPCPPDEQPGDNVHDPNLWFWRMFPDSANRFGPGFLAAVFKGDDGLTRFVPMELNEDAWAHALGGDRRLGHRLVFCTVEKTFWFFDPRFNCFFSTTEEKLKALLSSFLIRCAQEVGWLTDIRPLAVNLREERVLKRVIERAKALHAADASFFRGEHGHRRMMNGRIVEPTDQPSYVAFVERAVVRKPDNRLTVADAYHGYYQFCSMNGYTPLTRADFKSLMAETVRQRFSLALRKDVRDENGRQQDGWLHIDCDERALSGSYRN